MVKATGFLIAMIFSNCTAEPIAEWISDEGFSLKIKSGLEQYRTRICLPDSNDFQFPIYPNAEVFGVIFGREKPNCKPRSEWEYTSASASLLSKDDYEIVIKWYESQAIGYHSFSWNDRIAFVADTISKSEYDENHQYISSIVISRAGHSFLNAGYKTSISLNTKPSNQSLNSTPKTARLVSNVKCQRDICIAL